MTNPDNNVLQKVRFKSFADEDAELIISSDPHQTGSLMIMMREKYAETPGLVIVLDAWELEEFALALQVKASQRINPTATRNGLSVRLANRGEPYRSGMEVALINKASDADEHEYSIIEMFFEEGYALDELVRFVNEGVNQ